MEKKDRDKASAGEETCGPVRVARLDLPMYCRLSIIVSPGDEVLSPQPVTPLMNFGFPETALPSADKFRAVTNILLIRPSMSPDHPKWFAQVTHPGEKIQGIWIYWFLFSDLNSIAHSSMLEICKAVHKCTHRSLRLELTWFIFSRVTCHRWLELNVDWWCNI